MFQLVYQNLKAYRKAYQHYAIVIIFSIILCLFSMIGIDSYVQFQENQRKELYGSYHGAIYHMNIADKEALQNNQMIEQKSFSKCFGSVIQNERLLGQIGEYDDPNFMGIRLYQGRFPLNNQEIVMEMNVLDQMKISYDLNQKIDLEINNQTQSFQLVGICYNFSSLHKTEGQTMVNMLTKDLPVQNINCYFMVKSPFLDSINDFQTYGNLIVNNYTYSTLGENQPDRGYQFIVLYIFIFTIIAMMSISQYMFHNRQKQFMIMSQLGAIKTDILIMLSIEKTIVFFISLLISIVIVCLSCLIYLFFAWPIIVPYQKMIWIFLIYSLLHLLLCLLDSLLFKRKAQTRIKTFARKRKQLSTIRINYILQRTYKIHFITRCLLIAFSLTISAIGIIMIYQQYQTYDFMKKTYQYQYSYGDLAMPYENKNGMTPQEYLQLQEVYGIKTIHTIAQSPYYPISYQNDQSEYAKFIKNEVMPIYAHQSQLMGSLYGISDSLFNQYQSFVQLGHISLQEFENDTIILHLPTYYQGNDGWKTIYDVQDDNYTKMYQEKMIHVGDQITINHYQLTVGAIIYDQIDSWYGNINRPYGIICNQLLYQKITGLDTYQFVSIETLDHINIEQTDAELSRIPMEHVTLNNQHHIVDELLVNMSFDLIVVSILLSMIMIGFKVVFTYMNQSYEKATNHYHHVMNQLWITKKQMRRIHFFHTCFVYGLALLLSLFIVCIWIQNHYLIQIEGLDPFDLSYIFQYYIFNIPLLIWILMLLIHILFFRNKNTHHN